MDRDFISDNIVGAGTQKIVTRPEKLSEKNKKWLDKDDYGQVRVAKIMLILEKLIV